MIISWRHQFVFVHIYRTGGTNIKATLWPFLSLEERGMARAGQLWPKSLGRPPHWKLRAGALGSHATALDAKAVLPPSVFDRCFKFAFVRNPWALQVSLYRYMQTTPHHFQHKEVAKLKSFDAYVDWRAQNPDQDQLSFISDGSGRLLVDFVGRFESLSRDFERVATQIGLAGKNPRLFGQESQLDYRSHYTPRTRSIIANLHAADIRAFDYTFEPAARFAPREPKPRRDASAYADRARAPRP